MALFRCIIDNSYDGITGYRRGHVYKFPSNPDSDLFEDIPAAEANATVIDHTPLPAWEDLQEDWHIDVDVQFEGDVTFDTVVTNSIELNTDTALPSYKAGQVAYDPDSFVVTADTGIADVRVQLGQELHYIAINNTADDIPNGSVVYASGVCPVTNRIEIMLADASIERASVATLGLVTADILGTDSEPSDATARIGMVTHFGEVRDIPTSGLTPGGALWLSEITPGVFTQTKPVVGSQLILLGTALIADAVNGKVWVKVNITANSVPSYKSETFSSRGVGAGTYYLFGDLLSASADITLTDAAGTLGFGSTNSAYGMRPFAVFAGDGTVDTGQVGLRVTGTTITDGNVRTASDTQVITDDITAPLLDSYMEPTKKFIGPVVYELYTVSGSPTTYSVSFNYGLIKYEDFGNRDFLLTDLEIAGLGGANDTAFQCILLKQSPDGWTYSAAAFEPGNGELGSIGASYVVEDNIFNGEPFQWKIDSTALSDVILGSEDEGVILKIVTTANNTIQYLNAHIGASF